MRTSPERTAKMMIIMLGIVIVGAGIFFSMWDFWISSPAPVVKAGAGEAATPAVATGKDIPVSLTFIESSDFRTLAFNALPGEPDHNPTIEANVGDKIIFNVENGGKSFHAFGVTNEEEGFSGIISGSTVASASNPLKPGEGGTSEFVPTEEGVYYYICTVPGHREQGMVGEIIVGGAAAPQEAAAPTGVSHDFEVNFVESDDFTKLAFNALPGEEGHNPEFRVASGDSVTFKATNHGKSFHAFGIVTDPEDFTSVVWNSGISSASNPLKPGESGEVTFTAGAPGTYYYICTVPGHALQGMTGKFIVDGGSGPTEEETEPVSSTMPAEGMEKEPEMIVKEEPETMKEESMMEAEPFSGTVSIPVGSSTPGCEQTDECYVPYKVTIKVGESVTWSNDDTAAHTVTSGTPDGGPNGIFDSSLFMAGNTFSYTFEEAGEFNYFCMVHPWMTGKINVT